jgi:3-oxoacyl-[acyl-carrier-protein] synthase II
MEAKRVVITGLGSITSLGHNVKDLWENILKGESGTDKITRFDSSKFPTKIANEVKDYDVNDYFKRKELRTLDKYSQFAIIASREAVKDSGIDVETIDSDRAGVVLSAGIGGLDTFQETYQTFVEMDGHPKFSPFFIPKMISNIASGIVSIELGFKGINFSTVSACASSAHAIATAYNYIQWGKQDIFLAGGSEATINELGVGGFNAMKALSTRNDDPKTASRPFDKDRDGFVVGEGGAVLVIEELEHAKARGAHIYAEIIGAGQNADAHHVTAPHPEGEGACKAMKIALDEGNITTKDVDYINMHGTSTGLGDLAETKAIKRLFGDDVYDINLNSTKSMTGHLLGAAGSLEVLLTSLAIQNDVAPPTINQFNLDPEIDPKLNLTANKAQEREINYALSNTFGFGGHNCSVLLKKYK